MIRKIIRILLIAMRDFDGFCSYYASFFFKRRYRIVGQCLQCGKCCQNIAIYLSDGFWQYPRLQRLVIRWYAFVYHFEWIGSEPDHKVLIFRCHYLQNNTCSVYKRRPYICRQYPLPRYFEKPAFLPGCGFDCTPS